jgi:hypothetical protein
MDSILGPAIDGMVGWFLGVQGYPGADGPGDFSCRSRGIRVGLPDICAVHATGGADAGLVELFRRRGIRSLQGPNLLSFRAFTISYYPLPVDAAGRPGRPVDVDPGFS